METVSGSGCMWDGVGNRPFESPQGEKTATQRPGTTRSDANRLTAAAARYDDCSYGGTGDCPRLGGDDARGDAVPRKVVRRPETSRDVLRRHFASRAAVAGLAKGRLLGLFARPDQNGAGGGVSQMLCMTMSYETTRSQRRPVTQNYSKCDRVGAMRGRSVGHLAAGGYNHANRASGGG